MRDDTFLKELGAKIKAMRLQRRIKQADFAEECGIDVSNLWLIEKGKRNLHICTLKRIAEVLNVKMKEIL
jgi:transcriptional regulator with XRE-family HTH domain